MLRKIKLILVPLLLLTTLCYAQHGAKIQKLKKEQSALSKKIKVAQETLNNLSVKKQSSVGKLQAIKELIEARNAYIQSLNNETAYLNDEMREGKEVVSAMERDLDSLRKDYAEMIYQASKINNNLNRMTLLLTSKSFNELSTRLKIMNQYADARRSQVRKINQVKESLITRNKELQRKKKEKEKAKEKVVAEKAKLNKLEAQQAKVLGDLNGQQATIKKRIRKLQQQQKQLNNLIKREIEKEIEEQNKKNNAANREGDKIASKEFELNKGGLPWPIVKCFVSGKFGKHPHAHLKNVTVDNKGLKLQTPTPDAPVRAIFNGTVVAVASIPGVGKVIMIKHGAYFTVYSGLSTSNVAKGAIVTTKQSIGKVKKNLDGAYELDFQIWKGKAPQNPIGWLYQGK